ncbi:signal recognition particle receptor subunit alpha [Candidatus Nanohalobium constans]|uniref:signal-recognition-particle GTPase n=1 Tax=Candidatus Nanohalobium constans TaxID=2565781 RepID=A0A5Q0UFY0_9ARCH|nr:signal recognition particle receptor subunit alpha [Candidatus Nanohalobium constans]QGA80543.1 signal recognition particle subunit SRP54 [Candidatus Nanohalobium constans]
MFDKIKDSIQKFSSSNVADEEAVEQLVKDIQRDLIKADVDVSLVSDLSDEIREESLGEKKDGLSRKEHVLEVVYNKLEELLGEESEVEIEPQTILLCGLYGAGKTTTTGKLADFYRKRGMKVGVIAADTDRPAAFEQLQQIADDVEASFYGEKDAEDPVQVVENGKEELDVDVLIVDSAGRNSLNDDLKQELSDMEKVLQPDEKYLVIPADIGQSARDQAENFDDAVGLSGVIVTKMDSSAKGGGALVACQHADISVKFIGTGEKMADLEVYDPVDFVSDMIGQPDLESLLEKIEELDTDPEAILEGEFTLEDFQEQMASVTDSGMMEEMMSQLPFSSDQIPDNVANLTEGKIQSYNVIIDSMTDEEVKDPSVINRERRERIANGSGTSVEDVQELIKHYRQTKNMVDKFDKKSMKRGNMQNMMQKLGL